MVGTGRAAENGILFKGGQFVERAHYVDTIVLDKTGTITNGQPVVTDYVGDNDTLQLLASAENASEHPLADAIVTYAKDKGLNLLDNDTFKSIPGHGIKATIHQQQILVGNRKLMNDYNISISNKLNDQLNHYEHLGQTAMMIAVDNQINGIIAVADTVKMMLNKR